ncbi:MAG: ABC transporter ATP-binding protein [Aestuariibacter sp.]
MLKISNLCKSRLDGRVERSILDALELSVQAGESVAITGASGSGKSTLLNLIAGLEPADSGQILLSDMDVLQLSERQIDQYRREQIGIVFQQYNLIDCLSVEDNIYFSARLNNNVDEGLIASVCEMLDIRSHFPKMPYETSGGEQQRIAVARALAHKPRLLLADEPTGNLDEKNSLNVAKLLIETCESLSTTLLLVTHSQQVASMTQRQLSLHNGQLSVEPKIIS